MVTTKQTKKPTSRKPSTTRKRDVSEYTAVINRYMMYNPRIFTNVIKVSGQRRYIQCYVVSSDNLIFNISGYIANVLGMKLDRDTLSIISNTTGMDAASEVVIELSRVMYGDPYKIQHVRM